MSNAAEQALLDLLFLNTDWANVGDAAGLQNSATAGSFYIALHTADPGEAGSQEGRCRREQRGPRPGQSRSC